MELKEIFFELKAIGLVRTQSDFSIAYLGKSARYFSFLLSTRRSAPAHVWLALLQRIERIAEVYGTIVPHKARTLYRLAEQARLHIERHSLLTIPRRRHSVLSVSMNARPLCQ